MFLESKRQNQNKRKLSKVFAGGLEGKARVGEAARKAKQTDKAFVSNLF